MSSPRKGTSHGQDIRNIFQTRGLFVFLYPDKVMDTRINSIIKQPQLYNCVIERVEVSSENILICSFHMREKSRL